MTFGDFEVLCVSLVGTKRSDITMLIYRDGMLFIHFEIRDAKRSKRLYRFTDVSGFFVGIWLNDVCF
ncbi:hypothetical protein XFFB_00655 [Xylella fastidiosa]|nr:hypothetical protein XFFB_00655 [Xylella fastidiosa]